jgi:hypothetical protein
MDHTANICGPAAAATTNQPSAGATGTAHAGEAEPEIAVAMRNTLPGPVAVYWHGVPASASAAAVLSLARALGPVQVQRVIQVGCAADVHHRLPSSLLRAGAELLLCLGAHRPRVLASAWHDLVVDDLLRHPGLATVVLAGAPAAAEARVAPVVRAARVQLVRLRHPTGVAAVAI